jgi:hypothetical protein
VSERPLHWGGLKAPRLLTRNIIFRKIGWAVTYAAGVVANPRRRATLIANPVDDNIWRLDILLQGDGETVFLDL